jgi:hypothetical protein
MKKKQYIKPKSNVCQVMTSNLMDNQSVPVNQTPGGTQRSKRSMNWEDDDSFEEEDNNI